LCPPDALPRFSLALLSYAGHPRPSSQHVAAAHHGRQAHGYRRAMRCS